MTFPLNKPIFPNINSFDDNSETLLKFSLNNIHNTNIVLKLASNYAYSLYANNEFVADGGLRCRPQEVILDKFFIPAGSNVHIILHYVGYNNNIWYRALFKTPFFNDFNEEHTWKCYINTSITFCHKISSQLMRQNVYHNEIWKNINVENICLPDNWVAVDNNINFKYPNTVYTNNDIAPQKFVTNFPDFVNKNDIHSINKNDKKMKKIKYLGLIKKWDDFYFDDSTDLMTALNLIHIPNTVYYTFDLKKNGLHKLLIKSDAPLFIFYSEINIFMSCWESIHRRKVKAVDAYFCTNMEHIYTIEWRGCRYLHIVTSESATFMITAIRKIYDFQFVPINITDDKLNKIYEACKNNLIANVDGGVIDTCWRERVQWTGDAYIILKIMSLICLNADPVVNNVLGQISYSYNDMNGMVQAAYPIHNKQLYIPVYHLFWCLSVYEHTKTKYYDLVMKSIMHWEKNYYDDKCGLLNNIQGWLFIDWYDEHTRGYNSNDGISIINKPNCIINILYWYICQQFNIHTKVTIENIHNTFSKNGIYSLYTDSPSSIHATAIVLGYTDLYKKTNIADKYVKLLFDEHMQNHTFYYGYFIAKALGNISTKLQKQYIIWKYFDYATKYNTIPEKIKDDASLAHGWSVGIMEFIIA